MDPTFIDYFDELGIDPAIEREKVMTELPKQLERGRRALLHPEEIDWGITLIDRVKRFMDIAQDPLKWEAYLAYRTQQKAAQRQRRQQMPEVVGVPLQPVFRYDGRDQDVAYTIEGLADKLDSNWQRAIVNIRNKRLEDALTYMDHEDYEEYFKNLIAKIHQLRDIYGEIHPNIMVEQIVILCSPSIAPARMVIDQARTEASGNLILPLQRLRPDQDHVVTVHIAHGESRGCLFGTLHIVDGVGHLQGSTALSRHERHPSMVEFELLNGQAQDVVISLPSSQLLHYTRDSITDLHMQLDIQPDTAHAQQHTLRLPLFIERIPAKARFANSTLQVGEVKKGDPLIARTELINDGELPTELTVTSTSHSDTTVDPYRLPDTGTIEITVTTAQLASGSLVPITVLFAAAVYQTQLQLTITGEIAPNIRQFFMRNQTFSDRLVYATLLGAVGAGLGIIGLLPGNVVWFLIAASVLTLGTPFILLLIWSRVMAHDQATSRKPQMHLEPLPLTVPLGVGGFLALMSILTFILLTPVLVVIFLGLLCCAGTSLGLFIADAHIAAQHPPVRGGHVLLASKDGGLQLTMYIIASFTFLVAFFMTTGIFLVAFLVVIGSILALYSQLAARQK